MGGKKKKAEVTDLSVKGEHQNLCFRLNTAATRMVGASDPLNPGMKGVMLVHQPIGESSNPLSYRQRPFKP